MKAELVRLLTDLRVRDARDRVEVLSKGSEGTVAEACREYLDAMGADDAQANGLLDIMESSTGKAFHEAAMKIVPIVGEGSLPRLNAIRSKATGNDLKDIEFVFRVLAYKNPRLYDRQVGVLSS